MANILTRQAEETVPKKSQFRNRSRPPAAGPVRIAFQVAINELRTRLPLGFEPTPLRFAPYIAFIQLMPRLLQHISLRLV